MRQTDKTSWAEIATPDLGSGCQQSPTWPLSSCPYSVHNMRTDRERFVACQLFLQPLRAVQRNRVCLNSLAFSRRQRSINCSYLLRHAETYPPNSVQHFARRLLGALAVEDRLYFRPLRTLPSMLDFFTGWLLQSRPRTLRIHDGPARAKSLTLSAARQDLPEGHAKCRCEIHVEEPFHTSEKM